MLRMQPRRSRVATQIGGLAVLCALALGGAVTTQVGYAGYGSRDKDRSEGYGGGYERGKARARRDAVAPTVTVGVARLRGRALTVPVRCDEACRVEVKVLAPVRGRRGAHGAVVGAGRETVATWWETVRVPVRVRAGKGRTAELTVRVSAKDAAGNAAKPVSRALRVRR